MRCYGPNFSSHPHLRSGVLFIATKNCPLTPGAPLLASQEENERQREDHTNPFAQPERTGIVRVHQQSQDQPGAKVEPDRRTTAPDSRAHAIFRRRRHQPRRPALSRLQPRNSSTACLASFSRRAASLLSESPPIAEM